MEERAENMLDTLNSVDISNKAYYCFWHNQKRLVDAKEYGAAFASLTFSAICSIVSKTAADIYRG